MVVFHRITKNMCIYGNAYVEAVMKGNKVSQLKQLNPLWIDVYRKPTGEIIGYSQIINDKKLILWGTTGDVRKDSEFEKRISSIESITHFKYNVIGSEKYGQSIIEPIREPINSKMSMEANLGKLLNKYVAPLIWAKVGSNEMPAQDGVVSTIAGTLRDLHSESEIVTSHLVDLQVLDFNSKGIDIKTPLEHTEQQIITGGQVPPVLLGMTALGDKGSEVQLRNWGRHVGSIQRELKTEFEDKIIRKHGLGTAKDEFVWTKTEEREWEIQTDILRGLVTDGILTAQKANDLLPPKFNEKLPEPTELLNQQAVGADGQQVPRPTQRKDTPKVKDNPNDPQQTTKNKNAVGRVVKNDRKVPIK